MKKIVISLSGLALSLFPVVAFAQTANFNYTDSVVSKILQYSNQAVTFLMVVATLYFIWTVISYIRAQGEAKDVAPKKAAMLRGIIGLFVIVAIWGIVRLIMSVTNVSGGSVAPQDVPCPPGLQYDQLAHTCR